MVDEDAGELSADGLVEQYGCHRRVDTSGESEDDAILTNLFFQFGHGCLYKRGRTPVLARAADVDDEVFQQQRALHGMEHLGVELDSPNTSPPYGPRGGFATDRSICSPLGGRMGGCECRVLHIGCRGDDLEAVGNLGDAVAVAHPHLRVVVEASEEWVLLVDILQVGTSVFARVGLLDAPSVDVGDILRPVADAQDRHFAHKLAEVYLECLGVVYREGRTRENDADDGP